jgi:outer membrane protein TolC
MTAIPRGAARPLAIAAAMLLGGCVSVAPDGGFGAVTDMTKARSGNEVRIVRTEADAAALAGTIRATLKQPLGPDEAVRIALLNNPDLQATYWKVGIAQADLAQAGRLPNPALGFRRTEGGGEIEIERSLTVSLVKALTAPLATRIEARRFEQARLEVAAAIERHAAETRRAWYEAVAAKQGVDYARLVNSSAEASAELSARMTQAGNASKLDLAREQAFHAEASAGVARATRQALAAREKLARLMGLWGENAAYTLPERLPELPAAPAELENVERLALEQRLDVQAAKSEAAATAAALGLTRTTRFINALDLGYVGTGKTGEPAKSGYEITLELPLFDWGSARVARAEGLYMQAVNHVAQVAVDARSEARESYLGYRTAYDLARHYRDQVIPLRKKISDETLLRYNGMLASSFELLADAREQASAVNAYIDALKEFWIAHTGLEAALGARVRPAANTTDQHKEHQK